MYLPYMGFEWFQAAPLEPLTFNVEISINPESFRDL